MQQSGGDGLCGRIHHRQGRTRQLHRPREVPAEVRVVGRSTAQAHPPEFVVSPGREMRLQGQRPFEVAVGVGIRVDRLRLPCRTDRVRVGLDDEARLREVVGQVGRRPDRARVGQVRASFEAACEPLVEATPAPRQQLGLDDLAKQLVPEAEGAGDGLELQHAMVERDAEPVVDLRVGHVQHLGEQAVVDRSAGDGGGLDQRHGPGVEAGNPRQEDVDHRPRVCGLTGREQLLDEQRVALGAPPDVVHHAGREVAAPDLAAAGVRRHRGRAARARGRPWSRAARSPRARRGSGAPGTGRPLDWSG